MIWLGLNVAVAFVMCLGFGPWGAVLEGVDRDQWPSWYRFVGPILQVMLILAAFLLTRRFVRHLEQNQSLNK